MKNVLGTANGCPTNYLCNTIPGMETTGCCIYDSSTNVLDVEDDRYVHHCTDASGCTTGWYCDPRDGVCHEVTDRDC